MPIKKKKKITPKRKTAKKKAVRKPLKKRAAKKKALVPKTAKKDIIGIVTHYFPKVRAAVVKLKAPLAIGDAVKIKGHTTDFTQPIDSIQIDHVAVNSAKKGQEIGLLVNSRVRQHDLVCRVQ